MKIIGTILAVLILFSGCGAEKIDFEKPVFETECIESITVFSVPDNTEGVLVPEENMDEIIEWIGMFRIDKKAGNILEPGSNVVSLRIEYSDGTIAESGINTIMIGKTNYEMKFERTPECLNELLGRN